MSTDYWGDLSTVTMGNKEFTVPVMGAGDYTTVTNRELGLDPAYKNTTQNVVVPNNATTDFTLYSHVGKNRSLAWGSAVVLYNPNATGVRYANLIKTYTDPETHETQTVPLVSQMRIPACQQGQTQIALSYCTILERDWEIAVRLNQTSGGNLNASISLLIVYLEQ